MTDVNVAETAPVSKSLDFLPPRHFGDYAQAWMALENLKTNGGGVPFEFSRLGILQRAAHWIEDRHFVTMANGKPWVVNLPYTKEGTLTFSSFESFITRHANWTLFYIGEKKGTLDVLSLEPAKAWLEWEGRREHRAVILDPDKPVHSGGADYNLWQGFGVKPKSGDWSTLREFLCDQLCGGDGDAYGWLIRWMARCVQKPAAQAETAVVLRGEKGIGKGTFKKINKRIFGVHSYHASSPSSLTSNFNGHLMRCCFLFADEVTWAGSKKDEGRLKAMITEDELEFEEKYQPKIMLPNRLKIVMATNNKWAVPASADERRYFVLDVPNSRHGDKPYWSRVNAAIEGDEMAALLHSLLELDISDFDHRNPPHTAALNRQKMESLYGTKGWWFDCLSAGEILDGKGGSHGWPARLGTAVLYEAYVKSLRPRDRRDGETELGRQLAKVGVKRAKQTTGIPRVYYYPLPPLDEARAMFLKEMRVAEWDWPAVSDGSNDPNVSTSLTEAANDNDPESLYAKFPRHLGQEVA